MNQGLILSVLLLLAIAEPSRAAMSLQEAINTTLEKNPKTRANDRRIEAMHERTRAARMIFMPNFNANLGYSKSNSDSVFNGDRSNSNNSGTSYGVGVSVNLYNGGADKYAAQAAEDRERAQTERYNSTKGYILYTKGDMAKNTLEVYTEIINAKNEVLYYQEVQDNLKQILVLAKTSNAKNLINSRINGYNTAALQAKFRLEQATKDFKYIVTVPAPEQLQTIDEVITSLVIPENSEKAFEVALQKSPDIKASNYSLQANEHSYQSQRAAAYRPQIDVGVHQRHSNSNDNLDNSSTSNSVTLGITVSYNFSPKDIPGVSAAQKEVEAAQDEKDAALDDIAHELESAYPKLENSLKLITNYNQAYQRAQNNIQNFLRNPPHDNTDAENYSSIATALSYVDSMDRQWGNLFMTKQSVLNQKFGIQKSVGTLFDDVKAAVIQSQIQK